MINQGHINNGEQYWTPKGKATIELLVRAAFGKDIVYIPAHHIAFIVGKGATEANRAGEIYEMASLETFLFNHAVAKRLFGDQYLAILAELAVVPEIERVNWLKEREAQWNRGQNDGI